MAEQDNYRVEVFSPVGIRTVTPYGIGLVKETYTRKDDTRFEMEVTLDGKVTFLCEDYQYFYDLSRSDRRYDEARADIYIYCNGQWILKWHTFIEIRKGQFDYERKSFECSFSLDNRNKAFDDRKSTEFNLLDLVSVRKTTTAQYIPGIVYTNGVTVRESLQALLIQVIGVSSVKSDFFQWNPDDPFYVIGNSDLLSGITFFHKSDIVKASSAGYAAATILNMTPEDLINNLCLMYNLQYTLDPAGNFRIEHVSWYSRGSGLDLTQTQYEKSLIGTRKFTYDDLKIFRLEKFTNEQSLNADFVGVPIRYENDFTRNISNRFDEKPLDEGDDVLTRNVEWITDIDAVYGNVNDYVSSTANREQDLEGVVILALDSAGNIESVPGILGDTPTARNNNVNSWAILQEDYWKYNRLFEEGYMNDVLTTFLSTQRIKIRERIIIPFCCDETINPEDHVITEYGNAVIRKLTLDNYRGTAEIELEYEDLDSLSLGAPIAIDDIYATLVSTAINTSASSLPTLIANDSGASSVHPQIIETSLGGIAQIFSNGHFVYTPPVGIIGGDLFKYIALNPAGRADSATVRIVLKTGTVYVHMYNGDAVLSSPIGPVYQYLREIYFYADPSMQVPLDLTGYGLTINYSVNHVAHAVFTSSFVASGYSHFIYGWSDTAAQTITTTILPGSYTIV